MGRSDAGSVKAEFDYASPEIAGPQFWDAVEKLRELGPLVWVESSGGFWVATTYDMNLRIAQDWRNFTSAQGVALTRPSFEAMPRLVPIELEPPRHRTFRREVNPVLTVKAVAPLEDEIRAIADELIDGFVDRGSCDIAVEFARKFPGTVFFRLLVHSSDEEFAVAEQAARRISFESDDKEKFTRSASELRAWAGRVFDDHAAGRASGADLAEAVRRLADTGLADTGLADSGETWPDDERKAGLQILAQGGIGTSASAIGAVMVALSADPGLQARVRADLSLVPGLIEEMLRLEAPVPIMFRTARSDIEIDGQVIREGDKVCMIFGAAGRDPAVFDHPDQVDLDRPHCRHMTFGAGIHRCIGSNLARLQIRVAVEQLVTRLGEFGIPDGGEVTYSSRQSRGPVSIPLEFTVPPRHQTQPR
jgi:cytochrome P450